eukprot:CAMPEP_0181447852 /NCGR_PEP_ID=MMETSP1110-20121109/26837_1 /TAXON_ID=174948 /ORGANISM="Symbiodinium sp., Strain CCMP421" /LENGTH=370 /DNA_ID=CAMNT_0023571981 /DNA_START=38 /DNA_END=1147 /DNA_ORIENTATION=-
MSGLAAFFEQRLTGFNSYFGNPNCLSLPEPSQLKPLSAAATVSTNAEDCGHLPPDGMSVPSSGSRSNRFTISNTMEASLRSSLANLGRFEPLSTLKEEFKFNKSFGEKVSGLIEHGYKGWRRVRGDGNCFYRAVGFGLLEQIVSAPEPRRRAAAQRLVMKFKDLSFEEAAARVAHEQLVERLSRVAAGQSWQEIRLEPVERSDLLASFQDGPVDHACIRAIRELTARCLLDRADDPALCGGLDFRTLCEVQGTSVKDFCNQVVLPMGVEAESVVMNAVVAALDIGLRLALLDRSEQSGLAFQDYEPPGASEHFVVHVQLRPGHYDLLYMEEVDEPMRQRRATLGYASDSGPGSLPSSLSVHPPSDHTMLP